MVRGVRGAVRYSAECNLSKSTASSKVVSRNLSSGQTLNLVRCVQTLCSSTWGVPGGRWAVANVYACKLSIYVPELTWKPNAWSRRDVAYSPPEIWPLVALCRSHLQHGIDACRSTFCVVEPHPGPHTTYRCGQLEKLPTAGVEFSLASEQLARSPWACAHRACTFVPAS